MSTPQSGQNDELHKFKEETNYRLDALVKQNTQILDLLRGKPLDPNDEGMLGQIRALKEQLTHLSKKIDKHELFIQRIKWTAFGMSIPSTYGIYEFIRYLLLKH